MENRSFPVRYMGLAELKEEGGCMLPDGRSCSRALTEFAEKLANDLKLGKHSARRTLLFTRMKDWEQRK